MECVYEQMSDATRGAGKVFWEHQWYTLKENSKDVEIVVPKKDDDGKLCKSDV